jgi:hypothetical protein
MLCIIPVEVNLDANYFKELVVVTRFTGNVSFISSRYSKEDLLKYKVKEPQNSLCMTCEQWSHCSSCRTYHDSCEGYINTSL